MPELRDVAASHWHSIVMPTAHGFVTAGKLRLAALKTRVLTRIAEARRAQGLSSENPGRGGAAAVRLARL